MQEEAWAECVVTVVHQHKQGRESSVLLMCGKWGKNSHSQLIAKKIQGKTVKNRECEAF